MWRKRRQQGLSDARDAVARETVSSVQAADESSQAAQRAQGAAEHERQHLQGLGAQLRTELERNSFGPMIAEAFRSRRA